MTPKFDKNAYRRELKEKLAPQKSMLMAGYERNLGMYSSLLARMEQDSSMPEEEFRRGLGDLRNWRANVLQGLSYAIDEDDPVAADCERLMDQISELIRGYYPEEEEGEEGEEG